MNYEQTRSMPGAIPEVERNDPLEVALLALAALIGFCFVLPLTRAALHNAWSGLATGRAGASNGFLRSQLAMNTHATLKLELSQGDHRLLETGICPLCHAFNLIPGPRGGLAQNKLCGGCFNEFNVGPASCEHLGRASPRRVQEAYKRQAV